MALRLTEGLGFFGERKKHCYVSRESTLVCEFCTIRPQLAAVHPFRLAWYVLVVVLSCSVAPALAVEVLSPSHIKKPAAPERHVWPELSYCGLKLGEAVLQNFDDLHVFRRPVDWRWIQAQERVENAGSELPTSGGVSALPVVAPREIGAKASQQNATNNSAFVLDDPFNQFFHGALLAICIVWPIIWLGDAGPWGGLKKPNVRGNLETTA